MKIAFLSNRDPNDVHLWSGTTRHIYQMLSKYHDVVWLEEIFLGKNIRLRTVCSPKQSVYLIITICFCHQTSIYKLLYHLNSAVFFLVRKFYMLRCLFGTLYVDMRCFGVSWVFSKHKIPHPNQWGILKPQRSDVYSRKTSE